VLYEFVLTPEVFDKKSLVKHAENRVNLKEVLKGICDNGLIASLDKDSWMHNVREKVNQLSPSDKDMMSALLKRINDRKRIVRYPKQSFSPYKDSDWLELALQIHQNEHFHSIITEEETYKSKPKLEPIVQMISNILDSYYWENRPKSLEVKQDMNDYNVYLKPVLKNAKSLCLIDPYLSPFKPRFRKTLEICLSLLRNHSVRIQIHCKLPEGESPRRYFENWRRVIQRIIDPSHQHRFKVYLWEALPQKQRFHDRFIITDQCAISIPGGLDCFDYDTKTIWHLLEENIRTQLLRDVDPSSSLLHLIGSREF
jgi:hypothetical protein